MQDRRDLVASARGDCQLDILITNGALINVLTKEVQEADIGIYGNRISLVLPAGECALSAKKVIDAQGLYVCPGFIDGHVHNESSMCTPAQWAKILLTRGTTTVCTDPHEIANVYGLKGIRYMLEASEGLPMRYYITVPSCVPAVPAVETAGATLTHREVSEVLGWKRVVAIAEAMDYPGIIQQVGKVTPIVEAGHEWGVPVEGHAPGVAGRDLQAYLAATGPRSSDHESATAEEMLEKVRAGMMVYARASTFHDGTPDIADALRGISDSRMFGFCTDDVMPHHLLQNGHIDHGVRLLIRQGIDPMTAIQMATINVALHYGLWGHGAIAPGWLADLLVLENLEEVIVRYVIIDGKLEVEDRRLKREIREPVPPLTDNSVRLPELSVEDFCFRLSGPDRSVDANAMDMSQLFTKLERLTLHSKNGWIPYPLPAGVSVAAIVPRHGQGRAPSLAFVRNYPLKQGAIASTISHDSHNLAILGTSPTDMLAAVRALERSNGGLVAVRNGKVIALVPLPIAGLMSPSPVPEIARKMEDFERSLPELGLAKTFPLELIAMALPVIPEVSITDKGLVDVATQELIPVFP